MHPVQSITLLPMYPWLACLLSVTSYPTESCFATCGHLAPLLLLLLSLSQSSPGLPPSQNTYTLSSTI
eukprot:1144074-Pelagomonas_calceolata.AAC.4